MSGATDPEWLADQSGFGPFHGLEQSLKEAGRAAETFANPSIRPSQKTVEAAAYRLQVLLSPKEGAPEALYFGAGSRFEVGQNGRLVLPQDGRLKGDTFFNAFFLEFWRKWAGIARIGIFCRASGSVRLWVVGHHADGGRKILAHWTVANARSGTVRWIWDDGGADDPVRLSVEVEALHDASIAELSFVTDRAPLRPLRLAVGLVTHDREALVTPTVRALADLRATMPELQQIHVVNHGRSFRDGSLLRLLEGPLFNVVEQPNLGGCGGFARVMIEALEAKSDTTHLLLMDDDIVLDARMIARAASFAAHSLNDVAIGGQAIELERPTLLQEAWGRLGDNWLPLMEGGDLDLSAPEALRFWDHCPDAHYNGWWFNMIPTRAVSEFGLPAPIFLRGDDIEYGLRLRAEGVSTVPLPGLGVWHASVRYKHVGAVQYYDLRNSLITAASHPEFAPPKSTLAVLGWVLHHLLVHRYRAAEASLQAISDFLDGPELALWPNGTERHRRLVSRVQRLPAPEILTGADVTGLRLTRAYAVTSSTEITAAHVLWSVVCILCRPASRRIAILQLGAPDPRAIQGEPYLLALDPAGNRCLKMVPRKGLFVALLVRALWLTLRYRLTQGRAARKWRERLPWLRSKERWMQEFGSGVESR